MHIGSGGAQTIAPASNLPGLGSFITLDATTQPGFSGPPHHRALRALMARQIAERTLIVFVNLACPGIRECSLLHTGNDKPARSLRR